MASDITLLGATYSSVPAVLLPKSGGGTVKFTDVTQTDAVESNVENGKVFFLADGSIALGTRTISLQSKNVTPSESVQSVEYDSGYDGLSKVSVAAISSTYVGTGITRRAASSLTASGSVVTVPSGYYSAQVSKAVSAGVVKGPWTVTGTAATMNVGTNTVTLSKTVSITPVVTTSGYVTAGTASNATVTLSATMTTKAATTYNVSTTDQTIASDQYLTGVQTIRGVTYTGLSSSYILDGVTVKIGDAADDDRIAIVSGNVTFQQYYTGNSAPATSLGSDGDIYLNTSGGGGGSITVEGITLTSNGVYTAPSGIAYTPVTVSVPMPSGTSSITSNGMYDISSYASASINVPQGVFPAGTSVITVNGIYDVSSYASASVSVAGGITPTGTSVITSNGTYDVTNYASASVNVSGGSSEDVDYVNFYDFDGTLLHRYTTTEFASMSAMPSNPDHSTDEIPLTSLGWNWSLADAKEFIIDHGTLDIGQMYQPTDGQTHVIIEIPTDAALKEFYYYTATSVTVDWGDGTTTTGTVKKHEYATSGTYHVKISSSANYTLYTFGPDSSGNLPINESLAYRSYIKHVRIGPNVTLGAGYMIFNYCSNLEDITVLNRGTSFPNQAFGNCFNLKALILPNSYSGAAPAVSYCYNLKVMSIPNTITGITACYNTALTNISIPDSVTSIDSLAFQNCNELVKVIVSKNVTTPTGFNQNRKLKSIKWLSNALDLSKVAITQCSNLEKIEFNGSVISGLPQGAFSGDYLLNFDFLPSSLSSIGGYAFQQCYQLKTIDAASLTALYAYTFQNCQGLTSIILPSSITSIPDYAFNSCYHLEQVTCLGTITSIGTYGFDNCWNLKTINATFDSDLVVATHAFSNCYQLTAPPIPSKKIETYTYTSCSAIKTITIGAGVTSIGGSAFISCKTLGSVYLQATTPPALNAYAFRSTFSSATFYIPASTDQTVLAAYQTAANWSAFASRMVEYTVE